MTQKTLTLAFLSPTETDHWVNRLTARISKYKFCHVELFFEDINQCFSVYWREKCVFRPKSMANPSYEIISFAVTKQEYQDCFDFCREAVSRGIAFDDPGTL